MNYIVTLVLLNIIVVVLLIIILRQLGYWGSNKIANKLQKDIRKEQGNIKSKQRVLKLLSKIEWVADNYGFTDSYALTRYNVYIQRLGIKVPVTGYYITAKQLNGIFKVFNIIGIFCGLLALLLSNIILFGVGVVLVFTSKVFEWFAKVRIADMDKNIENHFPDLYFSLYPSLTKGTEVRLTAPLRDFLRARDNPRGRAEMKYLLIFVEDYLKLIDLYNDDLKALKELRSKYTFVMFINFANIASQALDGIDNRDKLLNFRIELQRKNRLRIEDMANRRIQWGMWSTWAIMAVMLKFIGVMLYLKFAIMKGM